MGGSVNPSIQVIRSDRPLCQRALPWALAILFSLLWGLLAGYAWAGEPSAPASAREAGGAPKTQNNQNGGNGTNGANGRNRSGEEQISLRPVALVYTQTEGRVFREPRGVFADWRSGEILVADSISGEVTIYTADGIPITAVGSNGEIPHPLKAVTSPEGKIYVLHGDPQAVKVFSYQGRYEGDLRLVAGEEGEPVVPTAITTDQTGNLYIGDGGKTARVLVYDPRGNLRLVFGSRGHGPGQFESVDGIAVDPTGEIYVLDTLSRVRSVQVFDASSRYLRSWGRRETGRGNFSLPSGIAVDQAGRIFVADTLRQTIQVYTRNGELLEIVGGLGAQPGALSYPSDVAADSFGRILVTERFGHRLQLFGSTTVDNAGLRRERDALERQRVRLESSNLGARIGANAR